MRARGLITLSVVALLGLIGLAGPLCAPVAGDSRGGGGSRGDAFVNDDGDPTALAADVGTGDGSGGTGAGGGDNPCEVTVWIEDDFAFMVWETEGVPLHSETGRWLMQTCPRPAADGVVAEDITVIPEGGLVDPLALALEALESISIPEPVIGTSPEANDLVVHVPTWLWVSGDWWQTYSETATAGRVSSTVTVEPTRAIWANGDGTTTTCTGPGVPWSPGMPENATGCSHTYTAVPGGGAGTFDLSVTVELDVSWSSNTGAGGVLPALSRTSGQPVRVTEIQAIETG